MEPNQPPNNQPPNPPPPQAPLAAPSSHPVQPAEQIPPAPATPPVQPGEPASPPPATGAKKPISKKMLLIGGGVVLLIIVIILGVVIAGASQKKDPTNQTNISQAPSPKEEEKATPTPVDKQSPSQIMLYGTWTGQTSVVRAVNLRTLESFLVATLPLAVKKVSVLSSQNLLFIDQIDTTDRGKRITVFNLKDRLATISIPSSSGYLIDNYVLSPDKKYIAIWEVQPAKNVQSLQGAKSRVYAVDLSRPTVKNLLYDEQASVTQPLHYPRAILNDGTVFVDTIMPKEPKADVEWAYGMSVVDFDGTNKREIEAMKAGTYGTRPSLAPDGKYLLFAGYSGGDEQPESRQAILTPNTVELLNTQTLKRFILPNLPSSNIYSSAEWEAETGNVIMNAHARGSATNEVYSYDLAKQTPNKISFPTNVAKYIYLSRVSETRALIGTQDIRPSSLGNLGDDYAYAFTQMAILDIPTQKASFFPVQDTFAQYITLLPLNYFKTTLGH